MKSHGKLSIRSFGLMIFAVFFLAASAVLAKEGPSGKKGQRINKVAGSPASTILNINNITAWVYDDGLFPPDVGGSWIGEFPKLSGVGFIYQEGIVFGGFVNDGGTPSLRVGGTTYPTGMQAGKVLQSASGVTTGSESPDAPDVRIWRVRPDVYPGQPANSVPELTSDAATYNQVKTIAVTQAQKNEIQQQYYTDWKEWPATKGAPWYVDTVGIVQYNDASHSYDPNNPHDIPGIPGASQTVWFVCNDLNPGLVSALYGSPSIGIEEQQTLWAYSTSTPLNNIYFKHVKLIYTGTANSNPNSTIDSMYVVQWRDPDNGDAGDDFSGCDSTLSLGFCYNGQPTDAKYASIGLPPPASGAVFLQGPSYYSGNPDDSAVVDFVWRHGYSYWHPKALTGFDYFAAGTTINDPVLGGDYTGTQEWFNLMRGDLPDPAYPQGTPFYQSSGYASSHGIVTNYMLSGDPVTHSGWVDGYDVPMGDRRDVNVSGPFTLKLHDTVDVVVAMVGGLGTNYISSVSVLKYNTTFAHYAFTNLFKLPSPPPAPQVTTTALNDTIVLNWGNNLKSVQAIENSSQAGFNFEGYNVYQLPSPSSSISDGVRIATFDLKDGILTVLDNAVDPGTGVVITKPSEFGTDAGIQRYISVGKDYIRSVPLVNGQTYYFAVTAYTVNIDPGAPFHALESAPVVLTITPHSPNPGVLYGGALGDTVKTIRHLAGASDGVIRPIIVDPTATTGHVYHVTFTSTADGLVWNLQDSTTGKMILSNQTDFAGDELYPTVDGMMVKVQGPPPQIKSAPGSQADAFVETDYAGKALTPAQYDAAGAPYHGNKIWHSLNSTAGSERYYASAGGGAGSLDRMMRSASNAAGNNFAIKWADPAGPNWGVWGFDNGAIGKVPFELWKYSIATGDSERLIPILYTGGTGTPGEFGLKGDDPYFGYPATDWIYWYSDTTQGDAYKGQTGYAGFAAACAAGDTAAADVFGWDEYFARMIFGDYDGDGTIAPTGTIDRIFMTTPITASDVFSFTAPAVTQSDQEAKADVQMVNVFPNPYYGFQSRETNALNKVVTFNHLPTKATIQIFNLAGVMVRTIYKNDATQFATWDLRNQGNLPVASGVYIIYVDMGQLGSKILKLALVQQEQVLPTY